jgi:hypothetical protein
VAKRIRKTITISEVDSTPRPRRRKQTNTVLIVIVLVVIGLFLLSRTHQASGFRPQIVSSRAR